MRGEEGLIYVQNAQNLGGVVAEEKKVKKKKISSLGAIVDSRLLYQLSIAQMLSIFVRKVCIGRKVFSPHRLSHHAPR